MRSSLLSGEHLYFTIGFMVAKTFLISIIKKKNMIVRIKSHNKGIGKYNIFLLNKLGTQLRSIFYFRSYFHLILCKKNYHTTFWERKREREREKEKERMRKRERERKRENGKEREWEREKMRKRENEKEREWERERMRKRENEKER